MYIGLVPLGFLETFVDIIIIIAHLSDIVQLSAQLSGLLQSSTFILTVSGMLNQLGDAPR